MSTCESLRSLFRSRSKWLKSDRVPGKFVTSSMALLSGFWLEEEPVVGDFQIEQVDLSGLNSTVRLNLASRKRRLTFSLM